MAPETNRAHSTARHSGEPRGDVHRPVPRDSSPGRPARTPPARRPSRPTHGRVDAYVTARLPGRPAYVTGGCARVGPRVHRPGRPEGTLPGAARARYGPAPGAAREWAGQRVRHRPVPEAARVRHRPVPEAARVRHRRVCQGRPIRVTVRCPGRPACPPPRTRGAARVRQPQCPGRPAHIITRHHGGLLSALRSGPPHTPDQPTRRAINRRHQSGEIHPLPVIPPHGPHFSA